MKLLISIFLISFLLIGSVAALGMVPGTPTPVDPRPFTPHLVPTIPTKVTPTKVTPIDADVLKPTTSEEPGRSGSGCGFACQESKRRQRFALLRATCIQTMVEATNTKLLEGDYCAALTIIQSGNYSLCTEELWQAIYRQLYTSYNLCLSSQGTQWNYRGTVHGGKVTDQLFTTNGRSILVHDNIIYEVTNNVYH